MASDTSFYSIVVLIAVIILMLTLIWLGIEITKAKEEKDFPPSRPMCPDYWKQLNATTCEIPTSRHPNNKGIFTDDGTGLIIGSDNTPGWLGNNEIDMTDAGRKTEGVGDVCAKRSWANEFGIVWDGVSNFNKC